MKLEIFKKRIRTLSYQMVRDISISIRIFIKQKAIIKIDK